MLEPATGLLCPYVLHAASGKVYEHGWILQKLEPLDPGLREKEASDLHDLVLWAVKLARCYMHKNTPGQVSSRRRIFHTWRCLSLLEQGYLDTNRRITRDTGTVALQGPRV